MWSNPPDEVVRVTPAESGRLCFPSFTKDGSNEFCGDTQSIVFFDVPDCDTRYGYHRANENFLFFRVENGQFVKLWSDKCMGNIRFEYTCIHESRTFTPDGKGVFLVLSDFFSSKISLVYMTKDGLVNIDLKDPLFNVLHSISCRYFTSSPFYANVALASTGMLAVQVRTEQANGICIWDDFQSLVDGKPFDRIIDISKQHRAASRCLCFSADDEHLIVTSSTRVFAFSLEQGQTRAEFKAESRPRRLEPVMTFQPENTNSNVTPSVLFSFYDGEKIRVLYSDKINVYVFDFKDVTKLEYRRIPRATVKKTAQVWRQEHAVVFSPGCTNYVFDYMNGLHLTEYRISCKGSCRNSSLWFDQNTPNVFFCIFHYTIPNKYFCWTPTALVVEAPSVSPIRALCSLSEGNIIEGRRRRVAPKRFADEIIGNVKRKKK